MNKLQNKQKGFSLIELMIVVAIIGVLAAIAVPQYNNYIARGQVAEAMTLLGAAKTAIEEQAVTQNTFGINPLNGVVIGAPDAMCAVPNLMSAFGLTIMGNSVACVGIVGPVQGAAMGVLPAGDIVALFNAAGVNAAIAGLTVVLNRSTVDGSWSCVSPASMRAGIMAMSTVPANLLPASCN